MKHFIYLVLILFHIQSAVASVSVGKEKIHFSISDTLHENKGE